MKVLKNYFWNLSYQIFILIVPFITIPYISRVLGPEGVGINSYTNSIIQYFILIGSLGFSLYGNREIAYNRNNNEKVNQIFWGVFFSRLISVLISFFLLFFMLSTNLSGIYRNYILVQSIQLIAVVFDFSWLFMGMENFKITVIRNTFIKILSVIMIFCFIRTSNDVILYIFIVGLSTLLGNLTLIPYLRKIIKRPKLKSIELKYHYKNAMILFLPQISINIYIVFNKTLLGIFKNTNEVAFFDSSDKVIKLILTIVTSMGLVMLPHISGYFSKNEIKNVEKIVQLSIKSVLTISIPLMFGTMLIANNFVQLFYGSKFTNVSSLLIVQSVAIVFMSLSNVLGTQYLLPAKRNRDYTVAVTLGAIVNIISNLVLIPVLGALGAIISSVLSEFSVCIYEIRIVKKYLDIKILSFDVVKILIISTIMFTVGKTLNNFNDSIVVVMSIQILVSIIIFTIMSFVFKIDFILIIKNLLRRKNKE